MECPYCESPIFDATDATRVSGRNLHRFCAEKFAREFDDAFESIDATAADVEEGEVFDDMNDELRFAA